MKLSRIVVALLVSAAPAWNASLAQGTTRWYEVSGGAWLVPEATVKEMRGSLQRSADQSHKGNGKKLVRSLSSDTVQYQGLVNEERKQVLLRGSCTVKEKSSATLASEWNLVLDGGNCYYEAVYDPLRKRFISFQFNGEA
jgi:hypothetical protein